MAHLPLPRNARRILGARQRGLLPADAVLVSYVGSLPWPNETVYCDSGQRYEWRWCSGLPVWIIAAPGVDITDAVFGCFHYARPYPGIADIETRSVEYVTGINPLRLWPFPAGEFFDEGAA